jgi:hypothetical protein
VISIPSVEVSDDAVAVSVKLAPAAGEVVEAARLTVGDDPVVAAAQAMLNDPTPSASPAVLTS